VLCASGKASLGRKDDAWLTHPLSTRSIMLRSRVVPLLAATVLLAHVAGSLSKKESIYAGTAYPVKDAFYWKGECCDA
jgi:hypothetical protein